jgi:hypothetical protein
MNAVVLKLREKGKPKEDIQAFKASAPGYYNNIYYIFSLYIIIII